MSQSVLLLSDISTHPGMFPLASQLLSYSGNPIKCGIVSSMDMFVGLLRSVLALITDVAFYGIFASFVVVLSKPNSCTLLESLFSLIWGFSQLIVISLMSVCPSLFRLGPSS